VQGRYRADMAGGGALSSAAHDANKEVSNLSTQLSDLKKKLLSNVAREKGLLETKCWIWQRSTNGAGGYGRIHITYLGLNKPLNAIPAEEFCS
jgi:hypothetical protein